MKYFFVLVSLLFVAPAEAEKIANAPFAIIIDALNDCYSEAPIGPEVAKCALAKLRNKDNPDGYRVSVTYDSFDKTKPINMTLTIFNKYGEVFICKGIAQKTITFKKCIAKQKPQRSPTEEISITPPQ